MTQNTGFYGGKYEPPEGSLLSAGRHLVRIVSAKPSFSQGAAHSLQLEVGCANADGQITDFININPKSTFHMMDLVAATGGKAVEDVAEETWATLWQTYDNLKNEAAVARFCEYLLKRTDRPFWISVLASVYNNKPQLKVGALGGDRILACTDEEAKAYQPPVEKVDGDGVASNAPPPPSI